MARRRSSTSSRIVVFLLPPLLFLGLVLGCVVYLPRPTITTITRPLLRSFRQQQVASPRGISLEMQKEMQLKVDMKTKLQQEEEKQRELKFCEVRGRRIELREEQMNDDYCDCLDSGEDEWLTSACAGVVIALPMIFVCPEVDPAGSAEEKKWIYASRVGDGICDCCSGADEPPGRCMENTCELEWSIAREKKAKIQRGEALYPQFLRMGEDRKIAGSSYGSPPVSLLALKDECFSIFDGGYYYKLCFFKLATQGRVSLGSDTVWDSKSQQLRMTHGDGCFRGIRRQSTIEFLCADANRLVQVLETQICEYHFIFETPAWCTPKN